METGPSLVFPTPPPLPCKLRACDHTPPWRLSLLPRPLLLQLMTWGASSVAVAFTGATAVSVELDGRVEALPPADAWINDTRRDLPAVLFQVSLRMGEPGAVMHLQAFGLTLACALTPT